MVYGENVGTDRSAPPPFRLKMKKAEGINSRSTGLAADRKKAATRVPAAPATNRVVPLTRRAAST
jgi:hypothetical protein